MSLQSLTNPSSNVCSTCQRTKPCLYKDRKNATLKRCYNCYAKAKAQLLSNSGVRCITCPSTNSSKWYKVVKDDTLTLKCKTCYEKMRAEIVNNSDTSCGTCLATESSKWHRDKTNKTIINCNNCYAKMRAKLLNNSGISCITCSATKSFRWYNENPADNTRKKCYSCHVKAPKKDLSLKRKLNQSNTSELDPSSQSLLKEKPSIGVIDSICEGSKTDEDSNVFGLYDEVNLWLENDEAKTKKKSRQDDLDGFDLDLDLLTEDSLTKELPESDVSEKITDLSPQSSDPIAEWEPLNIESYDSEVDSESFSIIDFQQLISNNTIRKPKE